MDVGSQLGSLIRIATDLNGFPYYTFSIQLCIVVEARFLFENLLRLLHFFFPLFSRFPSFVSLIFIYYDTFTLYVSTHTHLLTH